MQQVQAIESEYGDGENTVIIAKNADANVFYTEANNTTICGFKIESGGYRDVTGIHLSRAVTAASTIIIFRTTTLGCLFVIRIIIN